MALSFWHDSLIDGDDLTPRPSLPGDVDADVAIVGAGFTGLWTAHSLLRLDPTPRDAPGGRRSRDRASPPPTPPAVASPT